MKKFALLLTALPLYAQDSAVLQAKSIAAQAQSVATTVRGSIAIQLASVLKQPKLPAQEAPVFAMPEVAFAPPEPACEALPRERVSKLIDDASRRNGISADLLNAVIKEESAFRPCAISEKGARGLMQLMPAAMQDFGVTDAFDPEQNVSAGAALLKQLITRYGGDLSKVLSAYNSGPARVDAVDGVPDIPETQRYVERILGSLQ